MIPEVKILEIAHSEIMSQKAMSPKIVIPEFKIPEFTQPEILSQKAMSPKIVIPKVKILEISQSEICTGLRLSQRMGLKHKKLPRKRVIPANIAYQTLLTLHKSIVKKKPDFNFDKFKIRKPSDIGTFPQKQANKKKVSGNLSITRAVFMYR